MWSKKSLLKKHTPLYDYVESLVYDINTKTRPQLTMYFIVLNFVGMYILLYIVYFRLLVHIHVYTSSVLPENLVTEWLVILSKQTIKSAQQTTMTYIYIKYDKIVLIFRSNIIIISLPSLRYFFDHYRGMRNSIFVKTSVTRFSGSRLDLVNQCTIILLVV